MTQVRQSNTVQFSVIHHSEHDDLCMEMKRSAWKSEENRRPRKRCGRQDLPPRRPSRDLEFISKISKVFAESEASDDDITLPRSRVSKKTKSILKPSKYTTPERFSILPVATDSQKVPPISNERTELKSSHHDKMGFNTTKLAQNHRDSILDLVRLVDRCKNKFDGSVPSLPSIVNLDDEDETQSSIRSNGSFNPDIAQEMQPIPFSF